MMNLYRPALVCLERCFQVEFSRLSSTTDTEPSKSGKQRRPKKRVKVYRRVEAEENESKHEPEDNRHRVRASAGDTDGSITGEDVGPSDNDVMAAHSGFAVERPSRRRRRPTRFAESQYAKDRLVIDVGEETETCEIVHSESERSGVE